MDDSSSKRDSSIPRDLDRTRFGPGATVTGSAGSYKIDRIIGSGAAAHVASARNVETDDRVAIKCLRPEALAYPEVADRFAREGRAVARLRGEHVAHVLDVGEIDDQVPFLVLEYLEGEDLETHLATRRTLPIDEAVSYAIQVCWALEEAHGLGIVHRDVKPANLFLAVQPDGSRVLKVLDFGVSKVLDGVETSLTKHSTLLGTAAYMSPEQLRSSKDVDAQTDVWAVGATLYELLVGTPPFTGATVHEVMEKLATNRRELVRKARPDVPEALERVVDRALARDRKDRHATIRELADALAPFAPAPEPPAPAEPLEAPSSTTLSLIGALVFLAAAVALALAAALR